MTVTESFQKGIPKKSMMNLLRDAINDLQNWLKTFRGGLTLFCMALLIVVPLVWRNDYVTGILITAMIFAIFAASWDLLAGITGQVSFGHSVFFGIAGYVTAALFKNLGLNWFLCIIIGALIAVLTGLIVGIPCLRLKGPYLALGTQAFALILFNLFMTGELLGGTEGISGLPAIVNKDIVKFFIIFGFMIGTFIILLLISKSNLGTILKSIRDDETGADAAGINTTRYKLIAFMISGFFAGIAGSLFALSNRSVNPSVYQPLYSFYAIIMASIGGISTISGSLIGAFLFVLLAELFRPLGELSILIFSIILIVVIRFAEHGLLHPALERIKEFYDKLMGR